MEKENKKEDVKQEEEVQGGIIEPELSSSDKKQPELTEEELELKSLIKHYGKYSGVFTPNDMANTPETVIKSDSNNLLFSIFSEVKKNNDLTAKLISLLENR